MSSGSFPPLRTPPRSPPSTAAESVSPDERRRAFEAMAFHTDPAKRFLDPMLLATLAHAAVDPVGERFEGEANELAVVITRQSADSPFETRILAMAAVEVWAAAQDGTAASRTALLRATGAFLLHDRATWSAIADREMPFQQEAGPESPEHPPSPPSSASAHTPVPPASHKDPPKEDDP